MILVLGSHDTTLIWNRVPGLSILTSRLSHSEQDHQPEQHQIIPNDLSQDPEVKMRIDEVQNGIYRIAGFSKERNISFNQFVLRDRRSMLIHTGPYWMYESVEQKVMEVLELSKLDYVALLHFESDEYGGMAFLESPNLKLVCSATSSRVNLKGWFNIAKPHIAVGEGESISLGEKKVRFLMTPHVHQWDSMMIFERSERALFPADLFLQQGDNGPVSVDESLVDGMIEKYRRMELFADERPVRMTLPKLERLKPKMIHSMHGSSLEEPVHGKFFEALRTHNFAYGTQ